MVGALRRRAGAHLDHAMTEQRKTKERRELYSLVQAKEVDKMEREKVSDRQEGGQTAGNIQSQMGHIPLAGDMRTAVSVG